MKQQVLKLVKLGIVDTSFIGLDSTPIMANTKLNNPKSFVKNKFSKENQPKNDADCRLGVHTASNQINDKNYEFYWGYKNHVLVDCITGLPIFELTTTANVSDSTVALDILSKTNAFLSVRECTFLADKGYDVKAIYNTVRDTYQGDCVIPLNVRNTKAARQPPAMIYQVLIKTLHTTGELIKMMAQTFIKVMSIASLSAMSGSWISSAVDT